jgi:hypothetical protein
MNDIFSNMLNVCVIVYLDDILIYSDNKEFTANMSERYSDDSAKMAFMLELINALSTLTPLNTLVIFYLQQV